MHKILLLILVVVSTQLSAQQIQLFEQFNGRYDYTAFGNTLNSEENGVASNCTILTQSSATFTLAGSQTLIAARLYWSGSGTGDFDVSLNGTPVSASRTFGLTSGQGLQYFSAYADVTSILQNNGQGVYTLSDLDLTGVIGAYCGNTTNYGGWAIMVIYEDPSLTLNQISLFDGLESVSADNPSLSIVIDNIDVASQDLAKIGFLAWEGDQGLANNETLRINGTLIGNPPLNPDDNAFNGTNSYTNSPDLYNMDLDFFDIMNLIMVGDTSATIELTSDQDFVMVNNIITSINSENPDATIVIDNLGVLCENNDIDVNYTVSNFNSTSLLPANTPIAIYLNATLVAQTMTMADIPIGGSESGFVTLNLPPGTTPNNFNLIAVVDDDGTGAGIINETDETNNEFILPVDLSMQGLDLGPDRFPCIGSQTILGMPLGPRFTYQWFLNNTIINGATGATFSPSVDGTYKLEARNGICFVEDEVEVTFQPNPVAAIPDDLFECDDTPNDGFAEFDLTQRDAQIQNGATGTMVIYYINENDAEDGNANSIPNPTTFVNTVIGVQTIYARLEESSFMCGDVVPLTLRVFNSPEIEDPIMDYVECDNDGDGSEVFDLTSKDLEILDGLVGVTL
ncbi:CARDB domain-containing protein, partial [Jejudonia soesokkakensis]